MSNATIAHLALSAVYLLIAFLLLAESAYAHSGCALAAALIYAWLALPAKPRDGAAE
jgi:hypothetical protein